MKESEVRAAAERVLGVSLYSALETTRHPLPKILEQAAMECFLRPPADVRDRGDSGLIRKALLMLEKPGYFVFEAEAS